MITASISLNIPSREYEQVNQSTNNANKESDDRERVPVREIYSNVEIGQVAEEILKTRSRRGANGFWRGSKKMINAAVNASFNSALVKDQAQAIQSTGLKILDTVCSSFVNIKKEFKTIMVDNRMISLLKRSFWKQTADINRDNHAAMSHQENNLHKPAKQIEKNPHVAAILSVGQDIYPQLSEQQLLSRAAQNLHDYFIDDKNLRIIFEIPNIFRSLATPTEGTENLFNQFTRSKPNKDLSTYLNDPRLLMRTFKIIYRKLNLFGENHQQMLHEIGKELLKPTREKKVVVDLIKELKQKAKHVEETINFEDNDIRKLAEQEEQKVVIAILKELKNQLNPQQQIDFKNYIEVLVKAKSVTNIEPEKVAKFASRDLFGESSLYSQTLHIRIISLLIENYETVFEDNRS